MLKIYTKKGDKGKTSLFGGKCVQKSNPRVEAYGTIDELNSVIGVAIAQAQNSKVKSNLAAVQNDLFIISAELANTKYKAKDKKYLGKRTGDLEKEIDKMVDELPELHNFIIPGGGEAGSFIHFCRAICRRAERRVVGLSKKEKINNEIIVYLNRLSDFLFISARFINKSENKKEVIWREK
ncbi:MAG: cob(I)yrinic acid a,c-diamide adenosyltransferase [Patescibacteria group bacterium]|nr:cob(I)yrinic acid a,c-diamide adenosyltransferase [Patescibacteria group bacterium]